MPDRLAILLDFPQKGVYLLLMALVVLPDGFCLLLAAHSLLLQAHIVAPDTVELSLEGLHFFLHAHDF